MLSAIALEKAGFKGIGTTSWGIANTLGLADGELIDFDRHISIIRTITEHVQIPVSEDIEAVYFTSIFMTGLGMRTAHESFTEELSHLAWQSVLRKSGYVYFKNV